jgi:hypothetical protein
MIKKALLIFLTLIAIFSNIHAQNKVMFYVYANPYNTLVKVDTMNITPCIMPSYDHVYYLTEGKHVLKAWAPGFKMLVDTIEIIGGSKAINKKIDLVKTSDYMNYERLLANYKSKKAFMISIPSAAALGLGIATYFKYKAADKYYEAAMQAKYNYDYSITLTEISNAKAEFLNQRSLYNSELKACKRNLYIIGGILFTDIFLIHLAGRLKKPVFDEKNPLAHLKVGFNSNFKNNASLLFAYEF